MWCSEEGLESVSKGELKKFMEQKNKYPCKISTHANTRCFDVELIPTFLDDDPLDWIM